jgi:hypothetical protein
MSFVPVNPRPFLQDLVNKDVVVRLKWGETEYKGRLVVRYPTCLPYIYIPLLHSPSLYLGGASEGWKQRDVGG